MSFKPWDFFRKKLQGAPDEVASMTVGSSSSDDDDSDASSTSTEAAKDTGYSKFMIDDVKPFASRRTHKKRNQHQSNWWLRHLDKEESRDTLRYDAGHRDTKEFKGLFRVCFAIFEFLVELHLICDWHDDNRSDACGRKCSESELLALAALHTLGHINQIIAILDIICFCRRLSVLPRLHRRHCTCL